MHEKENLNIVCYFICSLLVCFSGGGDQYQVGVFLFYDTALEQKEQKMQLKGIWTASDPNHLGKRSE